jgi:predicted permease
MADIFQVVYDVILPIFLVIGLAALLGWRFKPNPRTLSTLLIYLFTPALVLRGLSESALEADELWQISALVLGMTLIMWLVGWLIARALKLDHKTTSAFLLTVTLLNTGNYGIPLNRFAFGPEGEARAVVCYAISAIAANTLGVYLVSSGSAPPGKALMNVFKVPLPYAAALGIVLNLTGSDLLAEGGALEPAGKAVDLLADAAVPGMLALLGIQLVRTSIKGRIGPILAATGARLVIAPVIAFPLAALIGLSGITRQVGIIEVSISTAVMSIALATEFDSDTEFTSAVILTTTFASVVTLSILLTILM